LLRTQDVSDLEWNLWRDVMADGFYMWLIGHSVLGQLIVYFGQQVLHSCDSLSQHVLHCVSKNVLSLFINSTVISQSF